MKRKIVTTATVAIIIASSIAFYSCRKKDNNQTSGQEMPTSQESAYVNSLEQINEQTRAISYCLAAIMDTANLTSTTSKPFIQLIESKGFSSKGHVSTYELTHSSNMNYFKDKTNSNSTSFLFKEALKNAHDFTNPGFINLTHTPLVNNGYDEDRLTHFSYDLNDYFYYIKILDWGKANVDPNRYDKTVVFVPSENLATGYDKYPMVGYYYDTLNRQVDSVMWQTENDFEDDERFYLFAVDYDRTFDNSNSNGSSDCSGENSPLPNDNYCDSLCGERYGSSQNDCSPIFNRNLRLTKLGLLNDYKNRCDGYNWRSPRLDGKYELAFICVIAHGNGKLTVKEGILSNEWDFLEVPHSKAAKSQCSEYKDKGGAYTPKTDIEIDRYVRLFDAPYFTHDVFKRTPKDNIVAENYNPFRDTIMIMFYEHDKGKIFRSSVEKQYTVQYNNSKQFKVYYYSHDKQGPMADKMNDFDGKVMYLQPNNSPVRPFIKIVPSDWPFPLTPLPTQDYNYIGSDGGADRYNCNFQLTYD